MQNILRRKMQWRTRMWQILIRQIQIRQIQIRQVPEAIQAEAQEFQRLFRMIQQDQESIRLKIGSIRIIMMRMVIT